MKRIESGIKGFDKLVEGGFPEGSCVLVKGPPGSGKTIIALQFCYYGALKSQPSIFISLTQKESDIISQTEQFGWKLPTKNFSLLCLNPKEGSGYILEAIAKEIKRIKAQRLVIDSLSAFIIYTVLSSRKIVGSAGMAIKELEPLVSRHPSRPILRMVLDTIISELKKFGCTTLLISEGLEEDKAAEFVCDGVIELSLDVVGKVLERSIRVVKMRSTKIEGGLYSLEIGSNGPKVLTK